MSQRWLWSSVSFLAAWRLNPIFLGSLRYSLPLAIGQCSHDSGTLAEVQEVFDLVAGRAPQERTALLDQVCKEDLELRQEVESLLAWEGNETLIKNALDGAAELLRPETAERQPGPGWGGRLACTG